MRQGKVIVAGGKSPSASRKEHGWAVDVLACQTLAAPAF